MDEKFVNSNYKLDDAKKKEIDDVRSIIRDTVMDFHNYVYPKYIMNYKDYLWFVAERLSTIDDWQSNINYPMISSTVDTMFWNIFDFGYEFWIKEYWLKNLCTKAFDFRWTGKKVFKEVVKEILICGKWYTKDYFIKEEYSNKFFGREIKQTVKTPSILYISVFDVLYDRSKWLENSSYKITRTFTSWDSIKEKVLPLLMETYEWTDKKFIEKKLDSLLKQYKDQFWQRFSMYDYNPVKSLVATSQWFEFAKTNQAYFQLPTVERHLDLLSWYWVYSGSMSEVSKNYFLNDKKSSYELVEYNTNTEKYIFINWYLIYFGPKRFNLWEIREATYSILPWTWNANWVGDKLQWLQKIQNTLWNASIDNIKLLLGPMFRVSGNVPLWKNGKINFSSFRAFKSNGQQDLEKIQMWVADFSSMNLMQIVDTAGQKETWMSNYVMWWGWAIERTQWGIDLKFNQYKSKLTPITDSIDQMMWNIARSWVTMYLKFFTKEELDKLWVKVDEVFETTKDWLTQFKTITLNWIDIRDIIDETNITFTYNSLDKVTKEAARENLMQNLQYLLQYAQRDLNMSEIIKVLAGQDFDPWKILKPQTQVEEEQPLLPEWQLEVQWTQPVEEEWDILSQLQNIV